jgi:hypothetical protein
VYQLFLIREIVMTAHSDRKLTRTGTFTVSLAAALASAWMTDGVASQFSFDPRGEHKDFSARVSAVAEHIRSAAPTFARDFPQELKIVQWRN